jgi:hypothetical protein
MNDKFYNEGYISYVRTLESRQKTPMTFVEYVAIQRKVFREDVTAGHGPVTIIQTGN